MKAGVRAVGIAESFQTRHSTLAAAVVRADRVVDGFAFESCTVGGLDSTNAITTLVAELDRADIQYLFLGAVAPAWYNVVDLQSIATATDQPVLAVTFEESDGLEPALEAAFDGEARSRRLERYRALPPRQSVTVGHDDTVFVRSVGLDEDEAVTVTRAYTPDGGRPEPLRVARLAARAADQR